MSEEKNSAATHPVIKKAAQDAVMQKVQECRKKV